MFLRAGFQLWGPTHHTTPPAKTSVHMAPPRASLLYRMFICIFKLGGHHLWLLVAEGKEESWLKVSFHLSPCGSLVMILRPPPPSGVRHFGEQHQNAVRGLRRVDTPFFCTFNSEHVSANLSCLSLRFLRQGQTQGISSEHTSPFPSDGRCKLNSSKTFYKGPSTKSILSSWKDPTSLSQNSSEKVQKCYKLGNTVCHGEWRIEFESEMDAGLCLT